MKANYNLTGTKRKELVQAIAEITGEKADYKRMPTCAYEIGDITVDKDGFKADKYYDMLESLYYKAAIYQCYYGVAPENISVTFQFKYTREQFPFANYQFPSNLGKKLADVTPEN